jgi:hypothetical protein
MKAVSRQYIFQSRESGRVFKDEFQLLRPARAADFSRGFIVFEKLMHLGSRTVLEGAKRRNVVAPPVRAERVKPRTRAPKARCSCAKPDYKPVTFPPIDVPALRASGVYLTLPRAHAQGYFISPLRGFRKNRCIYFSKTLNLRWAWNGLYVA